ncbi:MAG: hypothetical protein QNJ07_12870 [Woeseiaceae bacterium]|nr:hypothetical protein [Woeseiaceae bacterium]
MADAERLLNEAQYAFQSISYGESWSNRRNRRKATSLCKKIMRKYPGTTQAREAHSILLRLGEQAYQSNLQKVHVHRTQAEHHRAPDISSQPLLSPATRPDTEPFNWGGLLGWLFGLPKAILIIAAIFVLFLWGIFGPFVLVPLVAFVLFTGPFRRLLGPKQQSELNTLVTRLNDYIEGQGQV